MNAYSMTFLMRVDPYWRVFAVLLSILVCTLVQFNVPINHDIGWILFGAERMTQGAVYGRDIIEPNPPFIWFLNLPVVWLAQGLGRPSYEVYRVAILLGATAGLYQIYVNLNMTRRKEDCLLAWQVVGCIAFFCFAFAWRDFGQREYISLFCILVFASTNIVRLRGLTPGAVSAITAGILAAIGILLKPYLLFIPAVMGLYSLYRSGLKVFTWIEYYALAVSIIIALTSTVLFAPAYLTEVIPLITDLYWGFNEAKMDIIGAYKSLFLALLAWVAILSVNRFRLSSEQVILLIVALGFAFSFLWQSKGYTYHVFPVYVTVAIGILATANAPDRSFQSSVIRPRASRSILYLILLMLFVGFGLPAALWSIRETGEAGPLQLRQTRISAEVEKLAANRTFTAFSTHPFPGFPTALVVSARWVGRSNSHMAIPAIVKSRTDRHVRDEGLEKFARSEVMLTLETFSPHLVLVDRRKVQHAIADRPFDFTAFYSEDLKFAELWEKYRKVSSVEGFDFYVQADEQEFGEDIQ